MWCVLCLVPVRLSAAAIAWFEVVFGALFILIGVGMLVKFWLVRNVFEIKARYVNHPHVVHYPHVVLPYGRAR